MLVIEFPKTEGFNDNIFNREYLETMLLGDGKNEEEIRHNITNELDSGTAGFVMYINGEAVLGIPLEGGNFGYCWQTYGVLRGLNNAFYDVIKIGSANFDIGVGSVYHNTISLNKEGEKVKFSVQKESGWIKLDGKSAELIQAAKEVVKIVREYEEIWRQVVSEIKPSFLEEVMKRVFNNRFDGKKSVLKDGVELPLEEVKKEDREPYSIWMPLESALKEMK